jgi:hypothetical protein
MVEDLECLLEQLFRAQNASALNCEQKLVLDARQLHALVPSWGADALAAEGAVEGARHDGLFAQ